MKKSVTLEPLDSHRILVGNRIRYNNLDRESALAKYGDEVSRPRFLEDGTVEEVSIEQAFNDHGQLYWSRIR